MQVTGDANVNGFYRLSTGFNAILAASPDVATIIAAVQATDWSRIQTAATNLDNAAAAMAQLQAVTMYREAYCDQLIDPEGIVLTRDYKYHEFVEAQHVDQPCHAYIHANKQNS